MQDQRLAEYHEEVLRQIDRATPQADSWNQVALWSGLGAAVLALTLLGLPPDVLTPPWPIGTPHIVIVVALATAGFVWAMNPKRRYMRFAASLLLIVALPQSPLWSLVFAAAGVKNASASLHPAVQVSLVIGVFICLLLDYRLHKLLLVTESEVRARREKAEYAERSGEPPAVREELKRITLASATRLRKLQKRRRSNVIVAGLMILTGGAGSTLGFRESPLDDQTGSDAKRRDFDSSPPTDATVSDSYDALLLAADQKDATRDTNSGVAASGGDARRDRADARRAPPRDAPDVDAASFDSLIDATRIDAPMDARRASCSPKFDQPGCSCLSDSDHKTIRMRIQLPEPAEKDVYIRLGSSEGMRRRVRIAPGKSSVETEEPAVDGAITQVQIEGIELNGDPMQCPSVVCSRLRLTCRMDL